MPMPPKKGALPKFEDFEEQNEGFDDYQITDLTDEDFEDDNHHQTYNFNNSPNEGFNFGNEPSSINLNKEYIPLHNQQNQYEYEPQNYNQQFDYNQNNYNHTFTQNDNYNEYEDNENEYESNEISYDEEMSILESQGSPTEKVKGLGSQLVSKLASKTKRKTNNAIKKKPKLLIPIAIISTIIIALLIFFISQKLLPQRANVEGPSAKQANVASEESSPINKNLKDTEIPIDYAISYPNIEITAKKENLQGSIYLLYKEGDKLTMCSTVENSYEQGKAKTVELSCQGSDNLINAKLQQTYFIKSN